MNFLGYGLVVLGVGLVVVGSVLFLRWRPRRVPNPLVRAVLDLLGEQVAVFDTSGLVVRVNSAWISGGGTPVGTSASLGFDSADPVDEWVAECLSLRQPIGTVCRRGGRAMTLQLTPLVDEFGDLLGGVMIIGQAKDLDQRVLDSRLTAREAELIVPIVQGRTYRQVAEVLGVGDATVKSHLQAVFRKTGCRSRHELSAWALGRGPSSVQDQDCHFVTIQDMEPRR